MRKLAILLALSLIPVVLAVAQEAPAAPSENRYEVQGKFSFSYPAGWQKFARPSAADQLEWLILPGDTNSFFSPIATESDVPLNKWVEDTIKKMATGKRVMLSKAEFITAAGAKGVKLRWKATTASNRELIIDQYFFAGKSHAQFLFTGTSLFEEAEKFEAIYDANMKSLVFEN